MRSRVVVELAPWADAIWTQCRGRFAFAAVRDAAAIREMYDASDDPFVRLVLEAAGKPVGWVVCLSRQFRDHRYFGNLKVGSIVDCVVVAGFETAVLGAAIRQLRDEDVDLVVTNQSFGPIRAALRATGFLDGPSNFLFGPSPQLATAMGAAGLDMFQLTRGDGEGPVNL